MFKLFVFDKSSLRYISFAGVFPVRLLKDNCISIPFNGVHDSEATGYPLSAIKSRKALVSLAAKREGPGTRP